MGNDREEAERDDEKERKSKCSEQVRSKKRENESSSQENVRKRLEGGGEREDR